MSPSSLPHRSPHRPARRSRLGLAVTAMALAGLAAAGVPGQVSAAAPGSSSSAQDPPVLQRDAGETPDVVEVRLSGTAELDRLVATGVDLDHGVRQDADGLQVRAVVTPSEVATLEGLGFDIGKVLHTEQDTQDALAERRATIQANRAENRAFAADATNPDVSDVRIIRADYYTSFGTPMLSVEAKWASGQTDAAPLTVERDSGPGTELGSGGTQTIDRFVDAGVYLYHRGASPVTTRPDRVRITSPSGDVAIAKVEEWLPAPGDDPFKGPGYQQDFVRSYLTPTELYDRIGQLAADFPQLAERVTLPHQTNGYRRQAQGLLGTTDADRVGLDSLAWGHQGGNDVRVAVVHPGTPDAPLTVTVSGSEITVSSATDAAGAATSTAAQVVAAIDANPAAAALVNAYTYRGSTGTGIVPAGAVQLSDGLNAPATVSRDPHPVYALKLGKVRDGSKPGVFFYAQEHAREWVPPLVSIETAERLLRNYATHEPTRELLDNLEVWIMPSVNPDGGHYSFYDFASQRKNLVRYCGEGQANDANARTSWGVDVNRNYDQYSLFDGYAGASPLCTSGTFAGPGELSESESRNVDWVAARPNMTFSMNVHSSGNYFMWSPGAYRQEGRVTAPRPTLEEEEFFWGASSRILTAIKRHRGMSVTPARTGPVADVLYSAAGNSGDMNWYKHGIYAWNFEVGTQFQPPFESPDPNGASAHEETMEYANGLVEMLRVARDLDTDRVDPFSTVKVTESSEAGKVNVEFETNEPAAVFYTLDGTVPNLSSTMYAAAGVREGGERIRVPIGTEIRWITVDSAGNVERNFVPGREGNYRTWIAQVGWEPPLAGSAVTLKLDRKWVTAGKAGVRAQVQVTATGAGDQPVPTGVVDVRADGVRVGSARLDGSGRATVRLDAFKTAGTRLITAAYGGDAALAPSTSTPVGLRVTKAAATVRVISVRPNPVRTSGPPARTRARLVAAVRASGVPVRGQVLVQQGNRVLAAGTVNPRGRITFRLPRFASPGLKVLRVVFRGNDNLEGDRAVVRLRVRR